mmetsp:Transcript_13340/g.29509  ORF Transcript_13340/g.29509 Transcript_13340/m.29509 type:complete len:90 (+) Transcript_13340:547-816(+)
MMPVSDDDDDDDDPPGVKYTTSPRAAILPLLGSAAADAEDVDGLDAPVVVVVRESSTGTAEENSRRVALPVGAAATSTCRSNGVTSDGD